MWCGRHSVTPTDNDELNDPSSIIQVIPMLGPTTCLRSPHISLPTSKRIEEIMQYSIRFRIEWEPHAIHLQFLNTKCGSLATACCSNIDSSYLFSFELVCSVVTPT